MEIGSHRRAKGLKGGRAHYAASDLPGLITQQPLIILLATTALLLAACAGPRLQVPMVDAQPPHLHRTSVVMDDGYRLPLRRWGDLPNARAVVLALHGFNDYSNAFAALGSALAEQQVVTYAYDQRGFGNSSQRGVWGGTERMIADLRTLLVLLRGRHPGLPILLVGESMGGAGIIAADAVPRLADGAILLAPAVWSRDEMPAYQRAALWIAANGAPWLKLTGEGLDIRPSDNIEMLRGLGADPLVIKGTRADALWGVSNLMDRAAAAAADIQGPLLLLYGEHDEIIPKTAYCRMLETLPDSDPGIRLVLYQNGWHMLTRDLQGGRVIADIAAWIGSSMDQPPSGEETNQGSERLRRFCLDHPHARPRRTRMVRSPVRPQWPSPG